MFRHLDKILKGAIPVVIAFVIILVLDKIAKSSGVLQEGFSPLVYIIPIFATLGYYLVKSSK